MSEEAVKLDRKDFVSDQDVRWCPGCGDYSILAQVQKVLPELGIARENFAFISGIGCSSRFPYYMNTYGFHTIHGRAPALASGVKIANPNLQVWVITGDGDGLSIGGNHLIHALRRNMDLKILLFNNEIYGLTKGQYSPTSEMGKKTKSTPMGSVDYPIQPVPLALASEATFVARTVDTNPKHLAEMLRRAADHKGSAIIEIYQNCVIFNDGAFKDVTDRSVRDDMSLILEDGKPMIFGKDSDKGIRIRGTKLEVVQLGDGVSESDLLVHNESDPDPALSMLLSRMHAPEYPVPLGVIRAIRRPAYHEMLLDQEEEAVQKKGVGEIRDLLMDSETWTVQ
ncbi:MAG: 2-oxoacid:ferredoxin oxidoreductase subunit beta [Chrysiogenetes bacterium]|nr:2-oxoacid:ferredoxin oxidoreductase subunit beta [Chrysiogenetes bacterium]